MLARVCPAVGESTETRNPVLPEVREEVLAAGVAEDETGELTTHRLTALCPSAGADTVNDG